MHRDPNELRQFGDTVAVLRVRLMKTIDEQLRHLNKAEQVLEGGPLIAAVNRHKTYLKTMRDALNACDKIKEEANRQADVADYVIKLFSEV